MEKILVRYDGRYEDQPGDARAWTIKTHYIDAVKWPGRDMYGASFTTPDMAAIGLDMSSVTGDLKPGDIIEVNL